MALIVWKAGRRILEAIRHGILLARMQQEAQMEEAARHARENQQAEQIAELTAVVASHNACHARPIQQPQPAQLPR
ncbi:hypothetical protein FQN49_003221 [Arthroderma sp. PD_2]|nr:hypothetical protein FQN49_003221 [Arthroderma sp. PD_2]